MLCVFFSFLDGLELGADDSDGMMIGSCFVIVLLCFIDSSERLFVVKHCDV